MIAPRGTKHTTETPEPTYGYAHDMDCECSVCVTNDALGYDADISNPSQYCRHGRFIGSWWGPDILCGQCEMGDDY